MTTDVDDLYLLVVVVLVYFVGVDLLIKSDKNPVAANYYQVYLDKHPVACTAVVGGSDSDVDTGVVFVVGNDELVTVIVEETTSHHYWLAAPVCFDVVFVLFVL